MIKVARRLPFRYFERRKKSNKSHEKNNGAKPYFLYYEESLVSSNLNSKLFGFYSAHPNGRALMQWPAKITHDQNWEIWSNFWGLFRILLTSAGIDGGVTMFFFCATVMSISSLRSESSVPFPFCSKFMESGMSKSKSSLTGLSVSSRGGGNSKLFCAGAWWVF